MSIWNATLQACHSALIDELNVRFPKDKLELGLPKRFEGWGKTDGPDQLLFRELITDSGTGLLAIGTLATKSFPTPEEILESLVTRAETEFAIRGLDVKFGKKIVNPPALRMTIWLPIRIPGKTVTQIFDLGISV